jgi:hypothetical protein
MPTLNRFPLLGLWAREAARRLGHTDAEADTLGHAYAVLYALRAGIPARPVRYTDPRAAAAATAALAAPSAVTTLSFGGDEISVSRDGRGRLVGRVGGGPPQTPESYRYKVVGKFPAGYHDRLRDAFRAVLAGQDRARLASREVYRLYDRWKKDCAVGRLVDLDRLLRWCAERCPGAPAGAGPGPTARRHASA